MKKSYSNYDMDMKLTIGDVLVNILMISYSRPDCKNISYYHYHSSYELHLISQGWGTLLLENRMFDLGPGTIYLTGPGIYHEQRPYKQDPMDEYCLNFELKQIKRDSNENRNAISSETQTISKALIDTKFWFGKDQYNILDSFKGLLEELSQKRFGYYTLSRNHISDILVKAARCYTGNTQPTFELPEKNLNDRRRFIIDNYFMKFHEKDLCLDELADMIGLSRSQTKRIIEDYYGMGFARKLVVMRLELSKMLLRNTSMSLEEISEYVGFSSTSHFSRSFKTVEGTTPGAYRGMV